MKKLIAFLLVFASLTVCFAGCHHDSGKQDVTTKNTESGNPGDETVPGGDDTAPEKTYDDLTKTDLGGKTFYILTRDAASTVLWKPIDWVSDGEDQNEIPQAVYKRNDRVQRDYNCVIEQKQATDLVATATAAYIGGTGDYDAIVMPVILQMSSMAINGYYRDLTALNGIDPTDPWWDAGTNHSLSLFGKSYTLCGDINIVDDLATWCIMFNKFLIGDWELDDPYQVVEQGAWTMEEMYQNAAKVADTDHETYGKGMYGIATEFDAANAYLASAGLSSVKVTDTALENNTKSHQYASTVASIYDYMKDDNVQVFGDNKTDSPDYHAVNWGELYKIFVTDSALYLTATLSTLLGQQLSEMTTAFGLLPIPKVSSEQTGYTSTFQAGNATAVSILDNQSNAEDVATLLTAMAAASVTTLTPALYQKTLYGRKQPDPESGPMLDIILNHRTVDLGILISEPVRTILNTTFKTRGQNDSFVTIRTNHAQRLEEGLEKITKAIQNNFQPGND